MGLTHNQCKNLEIKENEKGRGVYSSENILEKEYIIYVNTNAVYIP